MGGAWWGVGPVNECYIFVQTHKYCPWSINLFYIKQQSTHISAKNDYVVDKYNFTCPEKTTKLCIYTNHIADTILLAKIP